ncbi:DUF2484 family protein [uncultured Paracoccus sp.]|uniref:DUF2484 family protein n=1 Tax=uncultured Paracoccus sp. TaxID=189685 RepID=UPI0025F4C2A6|nr:DUF2484 family protein [uncultured Paracoccus sp.]
MIHSVVLALAVVACWLALARLAKGLRPRQRQRALWALIATGVPILGWLTYVCGPLAGVAFLCLGVLMLVRLPQRVRTRTAP